MSQPLPKLAPVNSPIELDLYEVSRTIHPRAVHGWFASWRVALVVLTQLVFYGMAWLTWNGRQAVLFDLAARKFYIFGLVLWPQDFIFLTVLLIISALSLFLFTAVAGRLWCGYACPQTVYTEIFMWIERKIEGDRLARMKLDQQPWSPRKLGLKSAKHSVWIVLALWTGFTFVGYFHADQDVGDRGRGRRPRAVGDVLGPVLRIRHLRQRRLDARAGMQIHVPVCAFSERDVRLRHADHHLRCAARRAARLAQQIRGLQGGRSGRLRRLRHMRAGVPDRHRHPQRTAIRVHRLRRVHRRLRSGHGQDEVIRAA